MCGGCGFVVVIAVVVFGLAAAVVFFVFRGKYSGGEECSCIGEEVFVG